MKVLFVFLHGIGDAIMFTPAIKKYKEIHKHDDIYILSLNFTAPLWEQCPYVKKTLISTFKEPPHHGNPLLYIQERRAIEKEIKTIQKKEKIDQVEYIVPWSIELGNTSIPIPGLIRRKLAMEQNQDPEPIVLMKRIGVYTGEKSDKIKQEVYTEEKNRQEIERFLQKEKIKKFCIIHAEGSFKKKGLSEKEKEFIIEQVRSKWLAIILLQENRRGLGVIGYHSKNILNTVALIEKCDLFVGIDSGPAHIAETLEKPRLILSRVFDPRLLYKKGKEARIETTWNNKKIQKDINQLIP